MKNFLISFVLLLAANCAVAQTKGVFALIKSPTATTADYDNLVSKLDQQGLMDSYWGFHALGVGQQGGLFSASIYPDRAAFDGRLAAVNPTFAKATIKVPAPDSWEIHNSFFVPTAPAKPANAIIVAFDGKGMTAAQYDQIIEGLKKAGKLGVSGQIGHVCYKTTEGLKVVDVWESQQAFEAFGSVLMPLIAAAGVNPGQPAIYKLHALRIPSEADRNRDVLKQFYHKFATERSTQACLPLFDPKSLKVRFNGMPEMNIDGYKALGDAYLSAVPDLKIEIESIVAEGDKVTLLTRASGTQKGALPGLPATGKWFDYRGMEIATLKNGKIVDKQIITDDVTFLTQLGILPSMDPSAPNPMAIVGAVYENFGKGNIPAVLDMLTDDVVWTDPGNIADLYVGKRTGKAAVGQFFQKLNEYLDIRIFNVLDMAQKGELVLVTGRVEGLARKTSKPFASDFSMSWQVNQQGKVTQHHLYLDTDNIAKALAAK